MQHRPLPHRLLVLFALLLAISGPLAPHPSHAQDNATLPISRLIWSADGSHLAALTEDYLFIYDLSQPEADPVRIPHEPMSYLEVVFSPDNTLLALNTAVYEVATGQQVYTLTLPDGREHATTAFSPDGQWVAYGDMWGWLHIADATTGEVLHLNLNSRANADDGSIQEPVFNIIGLLFAPDGTWLAAADWGSPVTLWDTATWEITGRLVPNSLKAQYNLELSPDASLLITQDSFGYPHVWDLATLTDLVPEAMHWKTSRWQGFIGDTPVFLFRDEATGAPILYNPLEDTALAIDYGDILLPVDSYDMWVWLAPDASLTLYHQEHTTVVHIDSSDLTTTAIGPVGRVVAVSPDGGMLAAYDAPAQLQVWTWADGSHLTLPLPTVAE